MKNKKIQSFGIFGQKITVKHTNWTVTIEIKTKVNRAHKFFGLSIFFSNLFEILKLQGIRKFRKMTTLRQFTCDDLFRFNPVNLDPLTETYGVQFYLQYLARWPEYFLVAESPSNEIMGMVYQ